MLPPSLFGTESEDNNGRTPRGSTPPIKVRDLTKRFGEGPYSTVAVDRVSLRFEPGEVIGILGPNGAGKSTLIRSILGQVMPTEGTIRIGDTAVEADRRQVYRRIGAVLEGNRNIYWRLTVRENMNYFSSLQGIDPSTRRDAHDELLDEFDLREKEDEVVNDLSRGMKQKVAIACALVRETEVLFLDEPTLGLDHQSSKRLRQELRRLATEEDRTIFLTSHDTKTVESMCDRVVVMDEGSVIADLPVESLADLFETKAYAIELADTVPEQAKRRIKDRFTLIETERVGRGTELTCILPGRDRLYELLDIFREANLELVGVSEKDSDLEHVFATLTGIDGGWEVDRT